jgi:hypothetical protein
MSRVSLLWILSQHSLSQPYTVVPMQAVLALLSCFVKVDDILCGAAASSDRDYVLDGIASKITFTRSKELTTLLYATDIDKCAQYIQSTQDLTFLPVSRSSAGKLIHIPPFWYLLHPRYLRLYWCPLDPSIPPLPPPSIRSLDSLNAPSPGCSYLLCRSVVLIFLPPCPFFASSTSAPRMFIYSPRRT